MQDFYHQPYPGGLPIVFWSRGLCRSRSGRGDLCGPRGRGLHGRRGRRWVLLLLLRRSVWRDSGGWCTWRLMLFHLNPLPCEPCKPKG